MEKASLPIISEIQIQTKLKDIITKFNAALSRARLKNKDVDNEWMFSMFDLSKCKCGIARFVKVWKGKALCNCLSENRILEKKIKIINDQKRKKNDDNRKKQTALQKLKRRNESDCLYQSTTSSTSLLENSFVLLQKSRSLNEIRCFIRE